MWTAYHKHVMCLCNSMLFAHPCPTMVKYLLLFTSCDTSHTLASYPGLDTRLAVHVPLTYHAHYNIFLYYNWHVQWCVAYIATCGGK